MYQAFGAQLRPTIYDIAKRARVGIGTVSDVLNNHPSISKDTHTRLFDAMSRLNYQPYSYARGFTRGRTNPIVVVVPFFTTSLFLEILQGGNQSPPRWITISFSTASVIQTMLNSLSRGTSFAIASMVSIYFDENAERICTTMS